MGTTRANLRAASCNCSNCPPQINSYPTGSVTAAVTARWASATKPPKSRPRMFDSTTIRRWTCSRLTCAGPEST